MADMSVRKVCLNKQDGEATASDKALDADGDTDMDGGASPEEAAATSAPEQPGASCAPMRLLSCSYSTIAVPQHDNDWIQSQHGSMSSHHVHFISCKHFDAPPDADEGPRVSDRELASGQVWVASKYQ